MPLKTLAGLVLGPALLLLLPWVAMRFTAEVAWDRADFLVAWALLFGAGLAYQLATRRTTDRAYRAAAGLALATAFLLVWANLAVGLIGAEDNPANLLYAGVLAVGFVGAGLARFQPRGMARALRATALAQLLVPVVALLIRPTGLTPGVWKEIALNAGFALLFFASAWLFQRAARAGA